MLSTVTPSRRGCQLSSSVSIETIRSVGVVMRGGPSRACPQSGTHPTRPIEAAQPATAPARSKRDQLPRHDRRRRPLPLVRLLTPQEIEAPIPALDRAADHFHHERDAHALVLPARIAPALIEIHG